MNTVFVIYLLIPFIYLYIYLFIYGLFNEDVSIQDVHKCTVS